jgi:hypothetical protein
MEMVGVFLIKFKGYVTSFIKRISEGLWSVLCFTKIRLFSVNGMENEDENPPT